MPETTQLVINTGPLISLIAGFGDLGILGKLYERVVVPLEVAEEILVEGDIRFGAPEFRHSEMLDKVDQRTEIIPYLRNSLDRGEAAVIQLAMDENIDTVCIDEPAGRRAARLCGLRVTGSVGIAVRGKRSGYVESIAAVIELMKTRGIYLSERLVKKVLSEAGEL